MASILLQIARICNSQFKCNYLKKKKNFLNSCFHFWNLHEILNILEKKMIVIANVFPQLQNVKKLARTLSKEQRFRTGFGSQHVKAAQIPAKSCWQHIYHVFPSFSGKLIWKISPVVLGEILGVFLDTMTADDKYPVQDCKNLPLPIQMQLSEKRKTLYQFLVPFLESTSNFKSFEKKDHCHS